MEVVLLADKVGDPVEFAPAHSGTKAERSRFGKAVAVVADVAIVTAATARGASRLPWCPSSRWSSRGLGQLGRNAPIALASPAPAMATDSGPQIWGRLPKCGDTPWKPLTRRLTPPGM